MNKREEKFKEWAERAQLYLDRVGSLPEPRPDHYRPWYSVVAGKVRGKGVALKSAPSRQAIEWTENLFSFFDDDGREIPRFFLFEDGWFVPPPGCSVTLKDGTKGVRSCCLIGVGSVHRLYYPQ